MAQTDASDILCQYQVSLNLTLLLTLIRRTECFTASYILTLFHRSVFLCSLGVFSRGSLRPASWHVSQTIPAPVCFELPNDRKQLT